MREHTNRQPNDLLLYRRRMNFSQQVVAGLLGHSDSNALWRYERGRCLPSLATALRLEIIYRIPVAFLFPSLYHEMREQIRSQEESLRKAPGQQCLF